MYSRSKESHLFPLTHSVKWIEAEPFDLAFTLPFFPPAESTLLPQLLQTEKVMGLRFCPDKGVRTLSLLLTPLSHQWDQERSGERGALRDCQSKLTTQLLFKTICHWTPTGLFVSDPKTSSVGSMDLVVGRHIYYLLSYQMQETAEAHIFLDRVVGGKCLRVIYQARRLWLPAPE